MINFPKSFQKDINRAVIILKGTGCTGIYLFGSLAEGNIRKGTDIDLAIRGCPDGVFFRILGKLLLQLDHPVDLVNLDKQDDFAQYLEREGNLLQID